MTRGDPPAQAAGDEPSRVLHIVGVLFEGTLFTLVKPRGLLVLTPPVLVSSKEMMTVILCPEEGVDTCR